MNYEIRPYRTGTSVSLIILILGGCQAGPITQDGLEMRLGAGGKGAVLLDGQSVVPQEGATKESSGFFIFDYRTESEHPIDFPVVQGKAGASQSGRIETVDLQFEMKAHVLPDRIEFEGKILDENLRGERAVDVIFRVPFAPESGVQWWPDIMGPSEKVPAKTVAGIPLTVLRFAPFKTRRFRIYQPASGGCASKLNMLWLAEVEVYGRDQNENLLQSDRLKAIRVDGSSGKYQPGSVVDGKRNDSWEKDWLKRGWASANKKQPHWIEFELAKETEVSRMDVFWCRERFGYATSRNWRLERWDGQQWSEVKAERDSKPVPPGDAEKAGFTEVKNAWSTEVYPLACVTGRNGQAGLALALPPDFPCMFRLEYDTNLKCLELTFRYGLSDLPRNRDLRRQAPFKFVLYRVDGRWGFRDAVRRYYEFFPDSFRRIAPLDGLWMLGETTNIPNPYHYAYHEHGQSSWEIDEVYGIYTCPYILVGQREFETETTNYEKAIAELKKLPTGQRGYYGQDLRGLIENCSLRKSDGRYVHRFRRRGGSVDGSAVVTFPMNPDPSLFEGSGRANVGRNALSYVRNLFNLYPGIDGIYVDSLASWGAYRNARREHFEFVDIPLTHDNEGNVVMDNALAHIEFLKALRQVLPSPDKIIFGNGIRRGRAWAAFQCDVLGVEANPGVYRGPSHYAFFRTVARHKPFLLLYYYNHPKMDLPRQAVEEYIQSAVAFGIAPETRPFGKFRERDLDLYDTFVPILRKLGRAGWEPVTHATVSVDDLWFERFGDGTNGLYFTIYNPTADKKNVRVSFDLGRLPWMKGKNLREIVTGAAMPSAGPIQVEVPAKCLRVLQAGEPPEISEPAPLSPQVVVENILTLRESQGGLLRNPGFEGVTPAGRLRAWALSAEGDAEIRIENQGAHGGGRCLYIRDADNKSWADVRQQFAYVQPGRSYLLRFWVKQSETAQHPGRVYFQWRGAEGRLKQGRHVFPRSTEWKEGKWTLVAPAGARKLYLAFGGARTESTELWLDDVTLIRQPSAQE